VKLKPKFGEAYFNLGQALHSQGRLAEALTAHAYAQAFGFGSNEQPFLNAREGSPANPLEQAVRDNERLLKWEARFPALLLEQRPPADALEQVEFAWFCAKSRQLFVAAAGWYAKAFAAQPELAGDLEHGHRFNAACVAALASARRGKDAEKLDDQDETRWRNQALSWLQADLELWDKKLSDDANGVSASLTRILHVWQREPALTRLRETDMLAMLPEAERQAWTKLWKDVENLRARASPSPQPREKGQN